jgi:NAD(P)H-dependent FMN reductase
MNILAISGSLQSQSSNSALVRHAAAHCGTGLEVQVFDQLAELPHFNPELDGEDPPAPVRTLRAMAGTADAILIASPEYAHEMPGSLKNALDWLASSGELYGKPAAFLCASPSQERGGFAREALQRTLEAEGARVVMSTTVAMRRSTSGAPDSDPAAAEVVVSALETLRRACDGP